ncbi:DUF5716 family protein [Schlegelella sp. S2-27]|uniref:DUF5716 family protein n=1 Tax=Caldimonas mangrovi TaxID=2944811 RepID=A0ABT0YN03_9BURK|nr:Wadjet anti-phage system protein JetA family protein [Caldimonas mangrovi]MCM5680109.1 DUF5716 family protein [Caldimonas mangrovi]
MVVSDVDERLRQEVIAERYAQLFRVLPERLFAPLASANRMRYWALLCALHARKFGPEAPLPPSSGFPTTEIIREITQELQDMSAWEDEDDGTGKLAPGTPLNMQAVAIFHRLKDCGWLRVDKVGVRDMVTMAPAIAQFTTRLIEFAHTGPVFVAGKVRSIEANIKMVLEEGADGSTLQEAAQQTRALMEHVRVAGTSVRDLMAELSGQASTGEFVRRFFEDFVVRMFIGDYKELRTRDHPLSRRQEILAMVEVIQSNEFVRNRLLGWYLTKRAPGDEMRAKALLQRDILKIEELSRIDEYLDRLDDEIRRATRMAVAFLDYRLRASRPLDELVDHAIKAVVSCESDVVEETPFPGEECLCGARLALPRVPVERAPPQPLRKQVMSPEQEARARLQLKARNRRLMSAPKLAELIRAQLAGRDRMASCEFDTSTIEDVRAMQALCTVAAAVGSNSAQLKANARLMLSRFSIQRPSIEEVQGAISHIEFDIHASQGGKK